MRVDFERFEKLREECFDLIKKELAIDDYCKRYEGALQICFGSYFEPDEVYYELSCYICPFDGRGHRFKTLDEFELFLNKWHEEMAEREV